MMFRDKTLWGLNSAVLFMMIGVGMIVAVLPQRVMHLDGDGQSVGYLASAFAFSYILFQIPIGGLADKLGFKPFLIIGYLQCFLTGLIFFFATNSNWIFLARLFQGVGEAPAWALAPALFSIKYPMDKGKVIGIYNAVIHLGLTFGPVLGIAVARVLNEQEIFLVYSGCCLLGALTVGILVEPRQGGKAENSSSLFDLKNLINMFNQRKVRVSLTGIALYGAGYGIFLTTLPVFLLKEKSLNAIEIGIFFTLFYAAISLAQFITGPLSDKFGRSLFMIVGLFITAGAIAITPVLNTPFILLALTVASLGMGVFYLASMSYLNEIVPNDLKGTISGAYYLFWGIGMFFGPPIMSRVSDAFSFQTAFVIYSFLIVLVAVGLMKNNKC
ncbi:MFS transporter [Sporomusa aerivorans]|uniref:MFS transporter n=1 Tax=Sporomusa aerivorans TaxID=204936 RepID=UPI00352A12E7